jgi:hypothetical protein
MSVLKVTVKQSTRQGESALEGTFQLPGTAKGKLAKKDGTTRFPNRATLNQTARKFAAAIGWELQFDEPAKKAAKKSVKSKTSKKSEKSPASSSDTTPAVS